MNNDNFAYIHVRPGLFAKEHPLATIAVNTVPELEQPVAGVCRFAVGFSAQHLKKDTRWDASMGRKIARGRAEKSANRVYVHANENISRRDLIALATARVLEAVEMGELFASKKTTKALRDTLGRLSQHDDGFESFQHDNLAAE